MAHPHDFRVIFGTTYLSLRVAQVYFWQARKEKKRAMHFSHLFGSDLSVLKPE